MDHSKKDDNGRQKSITGIYQIQNFINKDYNFWSLLDYVGLTSVPQLLPHLFILTNKITLQPLRRRYFQTSGGDCH